MLLDAGKYDADPGHLSASIHYITSDQPDDISDLELSLDLLWERYNYKHDYPVIVLHEGLNATTRERLLRSGNRIWFALMDTFNPRPPAVKPDAGSFHALSGNPHHYSAGYRAMCEYNAGLLFQHPVFARFDYTMHLDTDSYFSGEVVDDPFATLEANGHVYGFVATKDATRIAENHLWDVTLAYMEAKRIHPRGTTWLEYIVHDDLTFSGKIMMNDFEVLALQPFRDPKGGYQDYFRYLQSFQGFSHHAWHNSLMTTLAVAMFHSDQITPISLPYAHQMDCYCGIRSPEKCVVRIPDPDVEIPEATRLQHSIAYLRNNGIGGLLECWPPERRGAAVCEESVLHGLPRCIG
jgi:alpha 1,2-mannosyltransferase